METKPPDSGSTEDSKTEELQEYLEYLSRKACGEDRVLGRFESKKVPER